MATILLFFTVLALILFVHVFYLYYRLIKYNFLKPVINSCTKCRLPKKHNIKNKK